MMVTLLDFLFCHMIELSVENLMNLVSKFIIFLDDTQECVRLFIYIIIFFRQSLYNLENDPKIICCMYSKVMREYTNFAISKTIANPVIGKFWHYIPLEAVSSKGNLNKLSSTMGVMEVKTWNYILQNKFSVMICVRIHQHYILCKSTQNHLLYIKWVSHSDSLNIWFGCAQFAWCRCINECKNTPSDLL